MPRETRVYGRAGIPCLVNDWPSIPHSEMSYKHNQAIFSTYLTDLRDKVYENNRYEHLPYIYASTMG